MILEGIIIMTVTTGTDLEESVPTFLSEKF